MKCRTVLMEKWKESLSSVLPVGAILLFVMFLIIPVQNNVLLLFLFGICCLILGMGLFSLGTEIGMVPIGELVGAAVVKQRKLWFIVITAFFMGVAITIAEPDLLVLAKQVPQIDTMALMICVAVGVGLFLVLALLRIFFRVPFTILLAVCYSLIFIAAFLIPKEYQTIAFDSGGVTTGPMTVPFIMALGAGIGSVRSDENAENDSFGIVGLSSIGPVAAVMILGGLYSSGEVCYVTEEIVSFNNSKELWQIIWEALMKYSGEVALAMCPVVVCFLLFQCFNLHLKKHEVIRIISGICYTYFGLVIFLTGVNAGFLPVGRYLGEMSGQIDSILCLVPCGMLIGFCMISTEPAVHVLGTQVEKITAGAIPKKSLSISLSFGMAIAVGISVLRIWFHIPLLMVLVPVYAIAGILMIWSPKLFTAIAFDSGGVVSGPMTAAFLLPFCIGLCTARGGNIIQDAFGIVAVVAAMPLIAIQLFGIWFRHQEER